MLRRQRLQAANTSHPCVRPHGPGVRSRAISSIWRESTVLRPTLNKNLILFNRKRSSFAADGRGAKPQGRRVCGSLRFPAVEPCFVRVLPRFRRACFARASAFPAGLFCACFRAHGGRAVRAISTPAFGDFTRPRRACDSCDFPCSWQFRPVHWFLRLRDLPRVRFAEADCRVPGGPRSGGQAAFAFRAERQASKAYQQTKDRSASGPSFVCVFCAALRGHTGAPAAEAHGLHPRGRITSAP